ncbi:MAG: subclass B1 metallo-beta-lactamase [Prolixibacteraceae bacterium]|nr:subclass B1 metallo-beta-lactamase [Prolixibacteraceae bacterium]
MRKIVPFILLIICATMISAENKIKISETIQLIEIHPEFYIHESYTATEYGGFTSNGLLLISNGKALMIDTPMTEAETKTIVEFLKDSMNVKLEQFIGGHFHDDCIGGMAFLKAQGVPTLLGIRTEELCKTHGLPLPDKTFDQELLFTFEAISVSCFYPGGGHTFDNIVVYFPEQQILFGGCLVKSADSRGLGNLADAVPTSWDASIEKVMNRFPDAKIVIPGHGSHGNIELLNHTRWLVNQHLGKNINSVH